MGRQLYRQRRFDNAIQELRSQLEIEPDVIGLHTVLANAYYFKRMPREAITEAEKSLTLEGDIEGASALESIYKSGGYKATLEWRIELLRKKAKNQYVSPVDLAQLSASLGRRDEAVHYLQEALDQRLGDLVWLSKILTLSRCIPILLPGHRETHWLAVRPLTAFVQPRRAHSPRG